MQDMKVIPEYSVSTAYKHLLGLQHNDKENAVYALFFYMDGDVLQVWHGRNIGIEKYQFADSFRCTDGYNLLSKQKDYEEYLASDVTENAMIADAYQKEIALFNAAYNPETTTLSKRLKSNLKFGKPLTIIKNAFEEYNPLVIKKDIKDLVVVDGCTPIFSTHATSDLKTGYDYIYELRLVKSICSDSNDVYFTIPCVQISQFIDTDEANKYYQDCRAESELFGQHALFSKLADRANPAIHQFIKYWSH